MYTHGCRQIYMTNDDGLSNGSKSKTNSSVTK